MGDNLYLESVGGVVWGPDDEAQSDYLWLALAPAAPVAAHDDFASL